MVAWAMTVTLVMAVGLVQTGAPAVAAAAPAAPPGELTAREIETLLGNQRLLSNMIKCVLDEGPCTHQGKQVKKSLPHQVSTGCRDCTQDRKNLTEMLFKKIKETSPDSWDRLLKKYDPTSEYRQKYNWLDI